MKEIKKTVENPPAEVIKTYRKLVEEHYEGMPPAVSAEVLKSACKW